LVDHVTKPRDGRRDETGLTLILTRSLWIAEALGFGHPSLILSLPTIT